MNKPCRWPTTARRRSHQPSAPARLEISRALHRNRREERLQANVRVACHPRIREHSSTDQSDRQTPQPPSVSSRNDRPKRLVHARGKRQHGVRQFPNAARSSRYCQSALCAQRRSVHALASVHREPNPRNRPLPSSVWRDRRERLFRRPEGGFWRSRTVDPHHLIADAESRVLDGTDHAMAWSWSHRTQASIPRA